MIFASCLQPFASRIFILHGDWRYIWVAIRRQICSFTRIRWQIRFRSSTWRVWYAYTRNYIMINLFNYNTQWVPETRAHCPEAPCVLLGLKKDLRDNPSPGKELKDYVTTKKVIHFVDECLRRFLFISERACRERHLRMPLARRRFLRSFISIS